MCEVMKPLFPLGQTVATPGVIQALKTNGQSCSEFMERHVTGDWGEILCKKDR